MPSKEQELKLTDLIDLEFLQKFQDSVAQTAGVANIIIDKNGPITTPSNFTDFCIQYVEGSTLGIEKCVSCDIKYGELAAQKNEPAIYTCRSGLTNFAVPIIVDGKHYGSILGGQVFTKKPDEEHFKKIAKGFRIDEEKYIKAVREVKIVSPEHVKATADLLFVVANAISNIAHKNLLLIEKSKRENFYRTIVDTIRSSLDIKETRQKIVNIIGETMKADRCFITEYDKTTDKFSVMMDEYRAETDIFTYKGIDINEKFPNCTGLIKKGEKIIINDKKFAINFDTESFYPENEAIQKYKELSLFAFPLYYSGELLGCLSISYIKEKHEITEDEINLVDMISEQIATAMYQAKLYKLTEKQAENEILLRKIISIVGSSLDLSKIKYEIVSQVGMYLKADRVFFADYSPITQKYNISETGEYLSSDKIQSLKSFDFVSIPGFAENVRDMHLKGIDIVFEDLDKYIENANGMANSLGEFFRTQGFMSLFAINMNYGDIYLGNIVVSYAEKKKITEDDVTFVKTIANQAGFAVHNARLYEAIQINAKREKLIGNVISRAISTFDLNEIKQIVNDIGVLTKADRCYFIEVDLEEIKGKRADFDAEYRSSPDIKSISGYKFSDEDIKNFVKMYAITKDLIVFDYDLINQDQSGLYKGLQRYSKLFGLKTCIVIPLHYMGKLTSALIIEYIKEKVIPSKDEQGFLRILGNQLGMAFNQIQLYQDTKKTAERETLLRKITENIRSSLDIEQTLYYICEETAKLFNVQRSAITSFSNPENNEDFTIRKEYKESSNIKGLFNVESISKTSSYWVNELKKVGNDSNILIFDNVQKSDTPNYFKKAYKYMGVKSMIGTTIKKGKNIWGTLVLSEYNYDRQWSEEEKTLLKTIADQIYLAINQAELFSITKKQAEREVRLRNIVENIRSSLDIEKTLYYICEEIAKLFNVQRVALGSFFNLEDFHDYNMRKEYKTDPKIKGFLELDNYIDIAAYWGSNLIGLRKILAIDNIKESSDMPNEFRRTYTSSGAKSIIGIAIKKGKNAWGTLVLAEYNEYRHWTEEEKNLLKTIADQVYLAINQAELFESERHTSEREFTLRKITEILRSTLDPEEIKKRFVEITAKYFNVDRCLFDDYNKKTGKFLPFKIEKLKSASVKSLVGIDVENNFPEFIKKIKKGRSIIIKDLEKTLSRKKLSNYKATYTLFKSDTKSDYGMTVMYKGQIMGILILHYTEKTRILTHDEFNFLNELKDQAGVALHQAELFEKEKENAEREKLIGNIVTTAISTFDVSKIKQMVTDVGIMTKADRCYFVEVDLENMKGKPINVEREYLSSPDIKSIVGYDFPTEDVRKFLEIFLEVKDLVIFDYGKIPSKKFGIYAGPLRYANLGKLENSIGIPFYYMNKLVAVLVVEYVKERVIPTEDDINFLRILGNQVGVTFSQIQLYQDTKKTAERENLYTQIIEEIRSSLDINEMKKRIVNMVGKTFGADRCFIVEYDKKTNKFLPTANEYLSSDDIISYTGAKSDEVVPNFAEAFKHGKPLIINNKQIYLDTDNQDFQPEREAIKKYSVNSALAIPLYYSEDFLGVLSIHYVKEIHEVGEDEITLMNMIADQVAIAIHQAQLYKLTQVQGEREKTIRTIIETVRSSLDINETKKQIVTIIGETLDADRCYILEYDKENDEFLEAGDEYLSSDNILEYKGGSCNKNIPNFVKALKNGKLVLVKNKKIYPDPGNEDFHLEEALIEKYNINSAFAIPLFYLEDFLGILSVHYVKPHDITEDEIALMHMIANQISIAIHQARLFKMTKVQAEREKISRNIIEILRSSMDQMMIKRLFVKNIGKYFNADRVFFSNYDPENKIYLPVDENSEYLSSPEEKSFVGFDWAKADVGEFIQPLLERRELKISAWEEYVKESKNQNIKALFEDAKVKSSYNFPVLYQQKMIGYFCIEFTHQVTKLADEDINRIRSICTQAGIALYQAELYQKAQESDRIKGEFIANISSKFREPLTSIIGFSEKTSKAELDCEKQAEYMDNINKTSKKLLDFTNYISDASNTSLDKDIGEG